MKYYKYYQRVLTLGRKYIAGLFDWIRRQQIYQKTRDTTIHVCKYILDFKYNHYPYWVSNQLSSDWQSYIHLLKIFCRRQNLFTIFLFFNHLTILLTCKKVVSCYKYEPPEPLPVQSPVSKHRQFNSFVPKRMLTSSL